MRKTFISTIKAHNSTLEDAKEMNIMSVSNPNFEEPQTSRSTNEVIPMDIDYKLVKPEDKFHRRLTEKDKTQLEKRLVVFAICLIIMATSVFTHNLTDFDAIMTQVKPNSTDNIWNSTAVPNRDFQYFF